MKRKSTLYKRFQVLSILFITLSFLAPTSLFGTYNHQQNITIVVSCVEDIGNGKLRVHFGYENPNDHEVRTYRTWSRVYYNNGRSREYALNTFEPGVVEKAFYQDIDSDDQADWVVRLSFWTVLRVTGDINSNPCQGSLPIIPGYNPPEGGKEYNSKIGAEFTALNEAFRIDPNFADAPEDIFQITGTKVLMEAVANGEQYDALLAALNALGVDLVISDPDVNRVTGWVEIGDLLLLNDVDALKYARPVYPGISNYTVPATGATNSQGDFAMHSDFARLGYDINGSGVKIGVLSNSYNTRGEAHIDVGNGDLPGEANPNGFNVEVEVLKDIIPTQGALSDEGRAMLQIVHDIAPGAELAFRTGYLGEKDMALGIRELANAGTDVIVDDLSYITEPFFRDGVISQTIDSVVSEGITFFSSAGNFGRVSYSGIFDSEVAPGTINGTAHDFDGNGDIFQEVMLREGSYTLVLQWDDGSDPTMNTTTTDLDLFLSDDAGFSLLGFNRENVGGFPIEVVPFSVAGDSVYANVVIARASGPENVEVNFKYILFRGGPLFEMIEYGGGSSTIVGHPNAAGAISVGAVRFDKNPVYNPSEYPVPEIMSFSSVGGTPVNGEVRAKPDITAPNGVNTTVDLGNGDWDDPIDPDVLFPNFFGTSASSPHAAGVAALIMEAKSVYDPEAPVDPDYIRAVMKSTAIDMDDPGEDLVSGSGFIQAHKALMTFANPSPYVENLILASGGGVPGEEITPFSFTVTGDFFTDSTQVLFRGEALESGVVVVDESTITVDHPGFIGNPEVLVYNPSISFTGQDGGYAEGIYFSNPVKQSVVIRANNLIKKYGEVLPAYSASNLVVTVDGDSLTLEEAVADGIMLQAEADRLSGLAYNSPAMDTSSAGIYIIEPSLYPEVDTISPSEIDHAISEKYILEFVNGNLSVEKLALKITPVDVGMVYGQELPAEGFDFLYEIGDSGVNIGNLGLILSGVEQEHTAALSNEIGLVRGVALVNGIPLIRGTALVNGVTMLRGIALVNGVEVKVEVEGSDTTVYVAGEPHVNGGSLIRGIALVNNRPFVNMTEIVRGIALVNGDQVSFDDGYMTELNGVPLENAVPAVRGIALVNGLNNTRGIALVNGHEVVIENGITTIDGQPVPGDGIVLVNGIPVLRGVALVNSSLISRGVALVNGLEVAIENGIPTGRGIALVNGVPTSRGIALVNGIPLIRGTALVNNLEVHVLDGEIDEVYENGALVNGLSLSRGIALVNEVALVNGGQLRSRGTALVNGIALADDEGDGEDLVNLENMNFMASGAAIANGLKSLRGTALVNGIVGEDGVGLEIAAGTVQEDGSIVFENGITSRGIALVNGLNYVRGTALVNGSPLSVRGTALVNGSTVNDNSNSGSILVFDATELGDTTENVGFAPMSFVTGTTVGKHWIIPPTYISNNFDISYGLGTLNIDPAALYITAEDKTKIFGEDDPPLTYSANGLLGQDVISGELIREAGENVGDYPILQGSVTAGEDYTLTYDSAQLIINPASMTISITAENKEYDGTRTAVISLTDNRLEGSELDITYTSALFEDKHVGEMKEVSVLGFSVVGADSANYVANTEAITTADIIAKDLVIEITADDKIYDGADSAVIYATIFSGLVEEDDVTASSSNGLFDSKDVGTAKPVTADVSIDGVDALNYAANTEAATTANITARELVLTITADDKIYDGADSAMTYATIFSGLVEEDDVTVSSSNGLFDSKDVGTAKPVTAGVYIDGADALNYTANTEAATTANITTRELMIAITADDKEYDGAASATIYASIFSGLIEDDMVTVSSSNGLFDDKHVGSEKPVRANVLTDGSDALNYTANTEAATTANITARELVIGITASNKSYDGTPSATSEAFVEGGLIGGDVVTVSSAGGLFDDKHVGTGRTVRADVSKSGADADNYYLASAEASATADITAIELVIGITTSSKIYDGTPDASTEAFVEGGLIGGDVVTVSSTGGLFDDKHVGTGKTVTAGVSKSGTDADNYYLASAEASATADITAIELAIGITASNKSYDGTPSATTEAFVEGGLIGGDAVTVSSTGGLFDDKHVGTGKTVTAGVSKSGTDADNYYLASAEVSATADITAIELVIGITAINKSYDGTPSATIEAFVEGGLIGGDAIIVSSTGGLFDDKNAGTGKTVTAGVSKSGTDADNYYLASAEASATADITAIELVIGITTSSKVYDGTPDASTEAFVESGLLGGDVVTVSSSGGLFDTKDVGTGIAVTAQVSTSGVDAINYTYIATAYAYADISKKEVYVTPVDDYLYINERDPLPQPAFYYDGWIAGDEGNENYKARRFFDRRIYDPEEWGTGGFYVTIPKPTNDNYSYQIDRGRLIVIHQNHNDDSGDDNHSKSASVSGASEEMGLAPDQLMAYPNPVVDKVYLSLKEIENYKLIQLYDFAGKAHQIRSVDKQINLLEIDMTQQSAGNYFIRVIMEDDSFQVVQIIKK